MSRKLDKNLNYQNNGKEFHWGPNSVTLNPEKASLLSRYAVGKVLDIGCGSGIYTHYLNSLGHDTTGMDSILNFVKAAKSKYPQEKYISGSAENIPFRNNSFDTIVLFDILEHVDDLKVVKESLRVANRLIISVPRENQKILTQYGLSHAHYLDRTHKRVYILKSFRSLLRKLNAKIVFLEESLPLSISGLLINRLAGQNKIKKYLLKMMLKPFLPEPNLNSTIFAVIDKI